MQKNERFRQIGILASIVAGIIPNLSEAASKKILIQNSGVLSSEVLEIISSEVPVKIMSSVPTEKNTEFFDETQNSEILKMSENTEDEVFLRNTKILRLLSQSIAERTRISYLKTVRVGTKIKHYTIRKRIRTCRKRKKRKSRCKTSLKSIPKTKRVPRYGKRSFTRNSKDFRELSLGVNHPENISPELEERIKLIKQRFIFVQKQLEKDGKELTSKNIQEALSELILDYKQSKKEIFEFTYSDEIKIIQRHIRAAQKFFLPDLLKKAVFVAYSKKPEDTSIYADAEFQKNINLESSDLMLPHIASEEIVKPPKNLQIERSEMLLNGKIELNEFYLQRYNFQEFKNFLFCSNFSLDFIEKNKILSEVEKMIHGLPQGWEFGLIRTLTKKIQKLGKKVSILDLIKSPVTLTNTGTNKTAIYNPDLESWTFHISEIGRGGIGNKKNSHATPLGSFLARAGFIGGRYKDERTYVIGIDSVKNKAKKKYYLRSRGTRSAYLINPDNYDNTNSHWIRQIRYHGVTTTFKKTIGCVRLQSLVAKYLRTLTRKYRYGSSEIMAGLPVENQAENDPKILLQEASLYE